MVAGFRRAVAAFRVSVLAIHHSLHLGVKARQVDLLEGINNERVLLNNGSCHHIVMRSGLLVLQISTVCCTTHAPWTPREFALCSSNKATVDNLGYYLVEPQRHAEQAVWGHDSHLAVF